MLVNTPTFAAAATSEAVSNLSGDRTPLDGLKNAGKSSVPYEITGTPFVSRTLFPGKRDVESVCGGGLHRHLFTNASTKRTRGTHKDP